MSPDGMTAGELGSALGLTSGATTIAIDRLVAAGYADRERDPSDARRRLVRLRHEGTARLREQYAEIDERVDAAISALTPAEREAVATFLQAVSRE
jgi:DNA-binding MarR family transcriptional regulator